MYKFDNCYWIVHSYSEYDGVVQDCGIRRCNNVLKIVDPENGSIFSIPCVVDYDMAASTAKVTKYIITPNNHAVIMVQGNEDTLRLFKTNTRYMLSGRPFKLYGYQNAVDYDLDSPSTLLYLDLYLDELRDGDSIETGLAENGIYNYTISINSQDLTLLENSIGRLSCNVLLNGIETNREVNWESSDDKVIKINNNGDYEVYGEVGESAFITATLDGNSEVYDFINILIGESAEVIDVVLEPDFNIIKQYESITFKIKTYYNGELVDNETLSTNISIMNDSNIIEIKKLENNYYNLKSNYISNILQNLFITVSNTNPQFSKNIIKSIKAVSMLG